MLCKHYLKQMHSKWCPGPTHKDKSHILHITRNILQGYFLPQLTCLSLPIHNLHNRSLVCNLYECRLETKTSTAWSQTSDLQVVLCVKDIKIISTGISTMAYAG